MRWLATTPVGVFFLALSLALVGASCSVSDPVARGKIDAFGTRMDIMLIGVDRQRAADITRILSDDLKIMEDAWHAWRDSPVTRMNALFDAGDKPFAAPPSVLPLLRLSKQLSQQSDDLFNPASGHLARIWGFQGRPSHCLRPPTDVLIEHFVSERPSMHDISIDGFHVASSNPVTKLDFRAIQLGYAIDQTIARLRELGIENARVSAAGNLRAIGSRDGHAWTATVAGPDRGGLLATLHIDNNEAAFTATPDENTFTWEGREYHDLIDPRSGYPASETRSVTVLHPNATTADAAANAMFIAGPSDWHRIARRMGIRYVMLTDAHGRIHMNPAMQARVKLRAREREVVISEPLS